MIFTVLVPLGIKMNVASIKKIDAALAQAEEHSLFVKKLFE
jgi:hypothetical protein